MQNSELADNTMLMDIWQWLHLSRTLVDETTFRMTGTRHPGVKSILKMENIYNSNISMKSEVIQTPWMDLGNKNFYGSARVYRYQ